MSRTVESGTCPVATFDDLLALQPDVVRCPYPAYSAQRAADPVAFNDRLGGWIVTRHEDILAVLRDTTKFSNRLASGPSSVSGIAQKILEDQSMPERTREQAARRIELSKARVLLFSDPPLHKRQRSLVQAGFTPRRVAEMHGAVEALATELIDQFDVDKPFDIVPAFSTPIPMTVIATLLGVPPSKMQTFKGWSNAFTRGVGSLDQNADAIIEIFDEVDAFYDYFTEELETRRTNPVDDLLSDLLAARLDGEEPLTLPELLQMLVQFLVAGNETTTNLLTTAVWRLASDQDLQQQLRADSDLIPTFVEEVLRLEAPVQGIWRVTNEALNIGETAVPADSLVYLVTGSANHDPDAFENPDELNLENKRARHLSFGRGEHACLGMNLAKLEAKIALEALLVRCRNIRLTNPDINPEFHKSFVLHGMGSLTVECAFA